MREFVALELPEAFADETAALARRLEAVCDGRFVAAESLHVTLAFLGELDEAGTRAALDAVESACAGARPVEVAATGLGTFGRGRQTTLWLGLRDGELAPLAGRVRAALAARGVACDERGFVPHVTLARRVRLPRGELGDLAFPRPGEATRVTLFRSTLTPDGARYKPLHSVELA